MRKGDLVVKVNKDSLYPSETFTVQAYFPYPGLAVHREVPAYPLADLIDSATRWRRWHISHVNSGMTLRSKPFKRLADAFVACKMIADILPWTSSADDILKCDSHRKRVVRSIVDYAIEGNNETEIASLVLESELKDGG